MEHGGVEEVLHPQAEPPRPIGVGGTDPTPGRAHGRAAQTRLVRPVQGHVVRHDHVRAATDPDTADVDTP